MSRESPFHRVHVLESQHREPAQSAHEEFLLQLGSQVAERFARITHLTTVILPVNLPGAESGATVPSPPPHPECAECAGLPECRESFDAHLAELQARPGAHWHHCPFGKHCGFVPVVWRGFCLAACKLVLPNSASEEALEHNIELLYVLVENFLARKARLLAQSIPNGADDSATVSGPAAISNRVVRERATNLRVREAIDYVDQHLADRRMTVASIAAALDMSASYLAHVFATQTGMRLSRYIASRRVELAKELLATTNWQIKRVALDSGHANSDWFSQVFRSHTGMTPGSFRRKARFG